MRSRARSASRFLFNVTAGHVLGVDIGAHSVAVSLADLRGQRVATVRRPVKPLSRPAARVRAVHAAISAALEVAKIAAQSVMAVTVGTPGTVPPPHRRIGMAPAIPGWTDIDIAAELAAIVDCPVVLENDANLAVVGERAQGVASDAADVMFLLLGERLGAGILVNDVLVRGRDGAAGEIGYAPVPDGAATPPGFGALESRVKASALVALGRQAVERGSSPRLLELSGERLTSLTAEAVTLAAAEGDSGAIGALTELTQVLAEGIAPALLTLNPAVLVIGGGISRAGRVLQEVLEPQLRPLLLYPPEVRVSTLGSEAVLVGAVRQSVQCVQRDVLNRIYA